MNLCSCGFQSVTADSYIHHYNFEHKNQPNFIYICPVISCSVRSQPFANFKSIRTHILTFHGQHKDTPAQVPQEVELTCILPLCLEKFQEFPELKKHLEEHIHNGYAVQCPFAPCTSSFTSVNAFRSHISRYHKGDHGFATAYTVDQPDELVDDVDGVTGNLVDDREDFEDKFLKQAALFYIQLQAKYHLPNRTIQFVIDMVSELHSEADQYRIQHLKERLLNEGFEHNTVEEIVGVLQENDIFQECHKKQLRSEHCRQGLYKSLFDYIEPVELLLGQSQNTRKNCFMHYVPISKTMNRLLADESFYEQYTNPQHTEDGIYSDWISGSCYKSICTSTGADVPLHMILYQDAFEIANPLGSARKKHKLLGVYMTIGNVYSFNRSKIDQMQLVLLCKESNYKLFPDKVLEPLLKDISNLETNGIIGPEGQRIHSYLCMICGDNLGSHGLGGFLESFSAHYFCRYCYIRKDDFHENPTSVGEQRTKQSHQECLEQIQSDPKHAHVKGVKADSPLNKLKYFHVCSGLPPCLGHDLFEGIVPYDVMLMLKYMIETQGWFDVDLLNKRINDFSFHGNDGNDVPAKINITSKRLTGHAIQNWTFLRFLPLLIGDKVNSDDKVWKLFLKLKLITELVTATKISSGQVEYLQLSVEEYLSDRALLFPDTPLRPKHHFLMHYPELILRFGPLIWVWTMRFESKHKYFKYVISSSQNFINVTKTLSTRHQLLQASYSSGCLYPPTVKVRNATAFVIEHYNNQFVTCLRECPRFNQECQDALSITHDVNFKGTDYKKGNLIVMHVCWSQLVDIGIIQCILLSAQSVFFVVSRQEFERDCSLGLFQMYSCNQERLACVCAADLPYDFPLQIYKKFGKDFVVPKSSFLD